MKRLPFIAASLAGLLLIIGAFIVASKLPIAFDTSSYQRNSLSPAMQDLLSQLEGPIDVVPQIDNRPELRQRIAKAFAPYQQVKSDISINWDTHAIEASSTSLESRGELILKSRNHQALIRSLRPEELNRAFHQLYRGEQLWLGFLQAKTSFPLGLQESKSFGKLEQLLKQQGYESYALPPDTAVIPDNINVLVVRATQDAFSPAQVGQIRQWLEAGKAMLWLQESKPDLESQILLAQIGIETRLGLLVDADGGMRESYGLRHPAIISGTPLASEHLLAEALNTPALFPVTQSLRSLSSNQWQKHKLLESSPASWNETGKLSGKIHMDAADESSGPHAMAFALERLRQNEKQRIVVVGDSDFASNDYLGYAGNKEFILRAITWLSGDDVLLNTDTRAFPDAQLKFTQTQLTAIAAVCLFLLPALLLLNGLRLWYRRRHA